MNKKELQKRLSDIIGSPLDAEFVTVFIFSEVIPEVLKSVSLEDMILESVGNSAATHTQMIKAFKQKALELYNINLDK